MPQFLVGVDASLPQIVSVEVPLDDIHQSSGRVLQERRDPVEWRQTAYESLVDESTKPENTGTRNFACVSPVTSMVL